MCLTDLILVSCFMVCNTS